MSRLARQHAEKKGQRAETWAMLYLMLKCYWPVARRVKTPRGEIDLIMRRGRQLVLVEVKARATLDGGQEAIHSQQQRRIMEAYSWWAARRPDIAFVDARCDAVMVAPFRLPRHIRNAFSL